MPNLNEYGFDVDTRLMPDGSAWDFNGFDFDGLHRETDTEFHPATYRTRDGSWYDSEGYNHRGWNAEGYDREGYDGDGYDEDGTDRNGNTRCDNGDCECCDCEGDEFEEHLLEYGESAIEQCRWSAKPRSPRDTTLYAGHEIEMYSRNMETADVDDVLRQLKAEYQKHKPQTRYGGCAIATHDGSLGSGGFEVQTVPLTRAQTYGIFEAIKVLGAGACCAWSRGNTVGHHIHLSRAALTEFTIAKMGVFLNRPSNRAFVDFIAQRAASFNHYEDNKGLKSRRNYNRHSIFNTQPADTVEFRMFKSNLMGRGILKNYDFAMACVGFCSSKSYEVSDLHWSSFLSWLAGNHAAYPYLHEFVRRSTTWRHAYVPHLPVNARTPHRPSLDAASRAAEDSEHVSHGA
jgi:hypothetical protein